MRKVLVVFLLCYACGCASYTASQMQLVQQARKGVAIWRDQVAESDQEVRKAYAERRKVLDHAFDDDVRHQTSLDADWVIESRKAYAAGLNALSQAEQTSLANNAAAKRDAAATDEALQKLAWLLSIQSDFESLFEKGGGK